MIKIQYVGKKPTRSDTVAGSGVTWHGLGDVQMVPVGAVPKLLNHPDVWALADEPADEQKPDTQTNDAASLTLAPGAKVEAPEPTAASITVEGEVIVLDGLDKDALHALAKSKGVAVHHASGADKVIAALQAAFPAAE